MKYKEKNYMGNFKHLHSFYLDMEVDVFSVNVSLNLERVKLLVDVVWNIPKGVTSFAFFRGFVVIYDRQ